jgi:1,4-alpha-glucan branching enzyme
MHRKLVLITLIAGLLAGCGSKTPPPEMMGGPELVEGGAVFRFQDKDAKFVYLVGDFNLWNPKADPMADENGDGQWTLFYPLQPGRYAYKFVVDGRKWVADPTNPVDEPDGFDGTNSILVIPGG